MKKYAFMNNTTIWTIEFKEDNEIEVCKHLDKRRRLIPTTIMGFSNNYDIMTSKIVLQLVDEGTIIIDLYS